MKSEEESTGRMELGNAELFSHLLVVIDYEDDSDGKRKDQIRSSIQLLLNRLSLQTHSKRKDQIRSSV